MSAPARARGDQRRPARPPMDARIRQRRMEVRRANLRRRRRILLAGVLVVALGAGGAALTRSPLFAITDVRVEGVNPRQARRILDEAQVRQGQNLLSADLDGAVARTSALPWVERASARREPPSTVVIEAVARKPVAILQTSHGEWLVDRDGVVIARAGKQRLPRVDVPATVVAVVGSTVDDAAVHNAIELHSVLPRDVRRGIRAIEAVGERTVRLRLALSALRDPRGFRRGEQTWVRMGTATDVDDQVAVLRALLAQLRRQRTPPPTELDIRVPANPTITP